MRAHERPVAHDEARGVDVHYVRSDADVAAAAELLDRSEARVGAPLVDEAERARLDHVAVHDGDPADHWHPLLARRAGEAVGYAGLSLAEPAEHPVGDVVVDQLDVVAVLLGALRTVAADHGGTTAQVWARHVDDAFVATAGRAGWHLQRRLLVLGRELTDLPEPRLPEGVELRHHEGSVADDAAVADVLAAAYAGTPEGPWTADEVGRRRGYDWFRPEDLLLAVDGAGRVLGVHWTKRRDERTGEVYNLAVHPDAHGRGLGGGLLDAGLAHLADVGRREVVLWVDAANEAGLRLYGRRGFGARWQDVALGCEVC